MKKKVVSAMLVMTMAVSLLAGCGTEASGDDAGAAAEETKEVEEVAITGEEFDPSEVYDLDNSDIKIGLTLMTYDMQFFQDMLAQAKATADELGVELVDYDGGSDTTKQANAVDDLVSQNVDALFLNPVDGDAIGGATQEANGAEIPVITVDVKSSTGRVECHVSSDNKMIGEEAAKAAVELLKEKNGSESGFIYILGYDSISSIRDRAEGFIEYIEQFPDIEYVHEDPDTLTAEKALEKMEAVLQTYSEGNVDVIFGANETDAIGVLSAADAAGRKDFKVIGVDDTPTLNEALADADSIYYASVVQQPMEMGKYGIELCTMAAQGVDLGATYISTPLLTITKDTIADYEKEMAEKREALADYYD
ncbi:MAG: substrate-binding domain-containing protein [Eubacteriales bacterium]|nr:substrate-binding domain-containing protein [Eubacteriales bacterium]